MEKSEVNKPEHQNNNIPSQELIHNDTEDGDKDAVHIIGVTPNADIDENSASFNTSVCVVSEKHSVLVEDDVNKVDEVDNSSHKSVFLTETSDLSSHSQGETRVIDTDSTTLLELCGSNSTRKYL